jgi:hypothetical protein
MPLNPDLYRRLELLFGEVAIVHEGEPMVAIVEKNALTGKPRVRIIQRGETYRVCCPYCRDSRKRLWIPHQWGECDPQAHSRNLWLCKCFNEDCLKTPERQLDLYHQILGFGGPREHARVVPAQPPPAQLIPAQPPGLVYPLELLSDQHPANCYLRARGFDLLELGRLFRVGYCLQGSEAFPAATGRLIIPIYFRNAYVGWQGRILSDSLDLGMPKYYTMPGLKKSEMLYNFDNAVQQPFVVICEGVTDVWRFGLEAVALFGKTLSPTQAQLICARWKTVIILLDGDAPEAAREIAARLSGVRSKLIVPLPADNDPADFDRGPLRETVFWTAQEKGIPLAGEPARGQVGRG